MDCDRVWDLLSVYADGEADANETAIVEEHIACCTTCARDLEFMQGTSAAVQAETQVAPPAAMRQAILNATIYKPTMQERFASAIRRSFSQSPVRYGALATAGAAAALTLTAIEGDLATAPSQWLVTATGYVENTGMGWQDAEHTSVGDRWGQAPTLVEGIPAKLTVPFPAERVEVWALDERGQRRATVPCQSDAGGQAVIAIGPQWKTLWYEVAVRR